MKSARIFLTVWSLTLAGGVAAQDANANAQKNALAKAQFMLRQATAEKAELQQQADALKQQVEKLARELAATQSDAGAAKQKMQSGFAETIEQWRQRDARQTGQLEELRAQLKAQAEQRAAVEAQLQVQTDNFNVCYGNNKQLFDINRELLGRYEGKGVFAALRQKEPFTGVSQVEVENLVQDYRYKLDDLTVNAPAAAPQ
jgi:chromosome segregation ATPase